MDGIQQSSDDLLSLTISSPVGSMTSTPFVPSWYSCRQMGNSDNSYRKTFSEKRVEVSIPQGLTLRKRHSGMLLCSVLASHLVESDQSVHFQHKYQVSIDLHKDR